MRHRIPFGDGAERRLERQAARRNAEQVRRELQKTALLPVFAHSGFAAQSTRRRVFELKERPISQIGRPSARYGSAQPFPLNFGKSAVSVAIGLIAVNYTTNPLRRVQDRIALSSCSVCFVAVRFAQMARFCYTTAMQEMSDILIGFAVGGPGTLEYEAIATNAL